MKKKKHEYLSGMFMGARVVFKILVVFQKGCKESAVNGYMGFFLYTNTYIVK